ncbi:MAG: NAD(P)/FAD-dependent oxidoreductase [Candidatus Eremiobacteraeota bacterium]|nr:NAD(P)/FAD-dependent oxidoreductase [Candidatus Eremiobacteraeota bacterium]
MSHKASPKKNTFDVIIIGAGPAGLFAAIELSRFSSFDILLIDKGKNIEKRKCPSQISGKNCMKCKPCSLLFGWGGSGAFSDGKLTLTSEVGGTLSNYTSPAELEKLTTYVDNLYLSYGAPRELYDADDDYLKSIHRKAVLAHLLFIPYKIRHLGTDKCLEVVKAIRDDLDEKITILTEKEVKTIIVKNSQAVGIRLASGEEFRANYVVVAPGRQGAEWLTGEAHRLNIKTLINPVDLGVRVEVPAEVAEPLTKNIYESKFLFYSKTFDDKVRTFCMCPYGEVVTEYSDGILTVNGHSYKEKKTDNTNFALLVSKTFTEPFKDPISYGQYISRLANLLSGGVMIQRLGDLETGRRSTVERIQKSILKPTLKSATPGDLSLVLPYRYLSSLIDMLKALDVVAPGIYSKYTLLYGVEVKFYSSRIEVNDRLETKIQNFFVAGDGAGITRGLLQASISGVLVARELMAREGMKGE